MAKDNGTQNYLQLDPENGRVFVAGAISYNLQFLLKKNHQFDETKDKLICVGDPLSDGKHALAILDHLLSQRWFYTVRSVTVQTLLDICTDQGFYDYEQASSLRMDWVINEASCNGRRLSNIVTRLRRSPALIDVRLSPQERAWFMHHLDATSQTRRKIDAVDRLFTGYAPNGPKIEVIGNTVSIGHGIICEVKPMFAVVSLVVGGSVDVLPQAPPPAPVRGVIQHAAAAA